MVFTYSGERRSGNSGGRTAVAPPAAPHAPVHPRVPEARRAVGIGDRPLASQFVRDTRDRRASWQISLVEIGPPLAILVDELPIEGQGPAESSNCSGVEGQKEHAGYGSHEPVGMGRTTGHIDDRSLHSPAFEKLLHPHTARGVGSGGGNAPKGGAGPHGDDPQASFPNSMTRSTMETGLMSPLADGAINPVPGGGDAPVHEKEVPPFFSSPRFPRPPRWPSPRPRPSPWC